MARKKQKKKVTVTRSERSRSSDMARDAGQPTASQVVKELISNRPAFVGFSLSILQLLGHTTWILLVWYLSVSGKAKSLTTDSWTSWLIVGVLGVSLILTFVALFVCLYFGLRKPPRVLAVIGFCLSFFVGIMASALVFMMGIRAMSGK